MQSCSSYFALQLQETLSLMRVLTAQLDPTAEAWFILCQYDIICLYPFNNTGA